MGYTLINIIDKIEVRSATSYANWLYTFIADMFKWELDFAPEWVPEFLLTRYGAAAVMYNDGDPVIKTAMRVFARNEAFPKKPVKKAGQR